MHAAAFDLGQTLLVAPDTPFARIAAVMAQLGWTLEGEPAAAPLVKGEPEFASWSWDGGKPFVVYSYNPVARLRVLDVAAVPPALRGAIAEGLPLLQADDVDDLLVAGEPRERLLGLWAAQETERLDLAGQVTRLSHDPEPVVAQQGRVVAKRFQQILEAREALMINLRLLAEAAEAIIRRLNDPLLTPGLKPELAELELLFDPSLAPALHAELTRFYRTPPLADPGDRYAELSVTAANAGLLRWPNELSDKFPRGYRNIAGWMNPKWIWCAWRWRSIQGGHVQYDGLVFVDNRWVWLPKAFRLVQPLLQAAPPGTSIH